MITLCIHCGAESCDCAERATRKLPPRCSITDDHGSRCQGLPGHTHAHVFATGDGLATGFLLYRQKAARARRAS